MYMKIGFTCGAFDLCHAGHMLMFKEAKEHCDYLIVGLNTAENFSADIAAARYVDLYEELLKERAV